MVKILLFLFAARPLLDCLIISLMMFNANKIPEASSYLAMIIIMLHYGYIGLKEIFQK